MSGVRRRSRLVLFSRFLVFTISLSFLVGWLTVPEYVRRGRNVVTERLNLSPEPKSDAFSVDRPKDGILGSTDVQAVSAAGDHAISQLAARGAAAGS
jgi:hypothetical protein